MQITPKNIADLLFSKILRYFISKDQYTYLIDNFGLMLRRYINWPVERDIYTFSFNEPFYKYLEERGEQKIDKKITRLILGLDGRSVQIVKDQLRRYKEIHTNVCIAARHWYDYSVKKETSEMRSKIRQLEKKTKIPPYIFPDGHPEIFYYASGLDFIPKEVIERTLTGRDLLDCGAYNGDSALIFSKMYNPRKVFCFEPEPLNYQKLLETIRYSKLDNVIPVNKGVGEAKKKARMLVGREMRMDSRIHDSNKEGDIVEIIDIDSFVEENDVRPGVIKMDIEGYESNAIEGAIKTIKKYRPILLISIYHNPTDFFEIKPKLSKQLNSYKFLIRHLVYNHPTIDTMLMGYPIGRSDREMVGNRKH